MQPKETGPIPTRGWDIEYGSGLIDAYRAVCEVVFNDVACGHWAQDYINAVYYNGITVGCSPNPLNYCPTNLATRASTAAFIIRAVEGEPPPDYCASGSPFTDVPSSHPFCIYIKRMYERGITTGYPDGTYRPNDSLKRSTTAAFIIRALEGEPSGTCSVPPFTDVPVDHPFCKHIERIKDRGITTGYPDGTYRPEEYVPRATLAVFTARGFLGILGLTGEFDL